MKRRKRSTTRKVVSMSVLDASSRLLDEVGPGQLVAISGLANSGKTSLARTLAADLVERGYRVGVVSVQPWDTDRSGRNIEYGDVPHQALSAGEERTESTTAVVYDYSNSRVGDEVAQWVSMDLADGRVVVLVSLPHSLFETADIRVVVGRPTRRVFVEVFGVEAPSDGVPSPLRGTAWVAARGGRPILISYRPT